MRRAAQVVVLASFLGGCTNVKLAQRDRCWVRQTSKFLGGTVEELGPCEAPEVKWSDDRLTRVVQECIARTEHHWQTRALLAWSQGQPVPERASDSTVLEECTSEATRALASDNDHLRQENELLTARLREMGGDRDRQRTRADEASSKLLASHEKLAERLLGDQEKLGGGLVTAQGKMAEMLGEAAKKASQPAVATATATSNSDGALTSDTSSGSSPAVQARTPVRPASSSRKSAAPKAPTCPPPLSCKPDAVQGIVDEH